MIEEYNLKFVKCPECGHEHDIGEKALSEPHRMICEECGEAFAMGPGSDDE